ncbi:MDR family MFS transporter [Actinomadura sp. DC4]|uniref:MDR family MFS transporter n=1 Tax=Actinomadura sp. DC4 TaxID=3055069 RepID=UPI0025B02D90|nr:MDR family MFS transporter [Actinomadura sp. DC4]MDN3358808.1 MDR family MFS transporter [Actinomadura sp. DC4]
MPRTERLDPALLKLAGILIVGAMAPLLDSTIVNVALGTLGRDLHTSLAAVQWVVTAYLLALAMTIPATGWLAGRFGAKRMWLLSLALFLAGSVLCGVAWDAGSLIFFRVVQGIGGGLMLPILQTLLMQAAGGRQIGRLMSTITIPALVGPILGPVIGGLIVGGSSWRWIFYVNVPVCLVALALAWRGLPDDTPNDERPQPLDLPGLLLLSPALAAIIYGLSRVGALGGFGHAAVVVPLAAGLALLTAFTVRALRTTGTGSIVDLRLFRVRSFAASSALLFLSGLSMFGAMLLLPLYYQQVRGQGVVAAGLLLAPQGLGSLLTRRPLGTIIDRVGARPVVLAGTVLTALGTVAYAEAGPHTGELLLALSLVVRGAGLSGATIAVMAAAYEGLDRADIPHASSTTRIMQQVGGSFGAAVLAVILQRGLAGHSEAAAFDQAFWWSLGFTALAVPVALLLPARASRT